MIAQLAQLLDENVGQTVDAGHDFEAQAEDADRVQVVVFGHQRRGASRTQVHGHAQDEQMEELDAQSFQELVLRKISFDRRLKRRRIE